MASKTKNAVYCQDCAFSSRTGRPIAMTRMNAAAAEFIRKMPRQLPHDPRPRVDTPLPSSGPREIHHVRNNMHIVTQTLEFNLIKAANGFITKEDLHRWSGYGVDQDVQKYRVFLDSVILHGIPLHKAIEKNLGAVDAEKVDKAETAIQHNLHVDDGRAQATPNAKRTRWYTGSGHNQ